MSADRKADRLTHLDTAGRVHMVDVGAKPITRRAAIAVGLVRCAPETVEILRLGELAKGDALAVARIAGIAGAKRTPDLVPLCHPVAITGVDLSVELVADGVEIRAQVRTAERTGIEMEALTAVTVAALTVIDMVKAVDRAAHIAGVWVERKEGGASGTWVRGVQTEAGADLNAGSGTGAGAEVTAEAPIAPIAGKVAPADHAGQHLPRPHLDVPAAVITVSDRSAAGVRDDVSGPILAETLRSWGAPTQTQIVPDDIDRIRQAVTAAIDSGAGLVITTGGTGITSRDVTPEAIQPLFDKELPGLAQAIRDSGRGVAPGALLSRGVAGIVGRSVVITLPGSPGGVRDGLEVLAGVIDHLVAQLADADHRDQVQA